MPLMRLTAQLALETHLPDRVLFARRDVRRIFVNIFASRERS